MQQYDLLLYNFFPNNLIMGFPVIQTRVELLLITYGLLENFYEFLNYVTISYCLYIPVFIFIYVDAVDLFVLFHLTFMQFCVSFFIFQKYAGTNFRYVADCPWNFTWLYVVFCCCAEVRKIFIKKWLINISIKIYPKFKHFHCRKCNWKILLNDQWVCKLKTNKH